MIKVIKINGDYINFDNLIKVMFSARKVDKELAVDIKVLDILGKLHKSSYYTKTYKMSEKDVVDTFNTFCCVRSRNVFDFGKECRNLEENHKVDENICNC